MSTARQLKFRRKSSRIAGDDTNVPHTLFKVLNINKKTKVPPIVKFRSYARLAVLCARLCKYSHENIDTGKSDFLSIIQNIDEFVPILARDGLFFDPKIYRANKEDRLPAEARNILKRPQQLRTKKDNQYLQIILRSIRAFAEYPNKMQSSLCQVGWYEAYEPKRVIVRQGQPPHAFYFILSGSVIVTTFDSTAGEKRFLVSLHRGMSFGELAVITRSKRQATVSTSTAAEFLCISAKDFEDIFMAGGIKSVTDPDHNSFIRSIPFLKHWPLEILPRFPQACVFHFFPRGQVLVRDSRYSDWLYIVKSGSISVLKKLKAVGPSRSQESESEYEAEEQDEESKAAFMLSTKRFGTWNYTVVRRKRKERKEPMAYKNNMEMEKRLEETLPGFRNTRERLGIIDYDGIIEEHKAKVARRVSIDIQGLASKATEDTSKEQADESEDGKDDKATKLPKIRRTSKGAYLASMPGKSKSKRRDDIHAELLRKQIEYDKKMRDDANVTVGRKTISNELDNKPIKDLQLTEADLNPMFVLVQVLERGQYFGVSGLVFPDQPSFSVVSNGSECIMISKKLFLEKANDAVMMNLREIESPYPGDDELQSGLQDYVDWQSVRSKIYQRLVQDKITRNIKRCDFVPQYAGQYCFRTGPVWR
ncbi:hypothetical protein ACJMK2_034898 [Sinanodonta woodiana]|uniref:Cyclic nucleotide-binding domain-containing protein n=1 Tax=Sinanodonta woodiana TaxID=1069815 RepID=A0ABD3WT35_SINWO